MENQDQRAGHRVTRRTNTETTCTSDFTLDIEQAQQFLTALDEKNDEYCFQIFPDKSNGKIIPDHKYATLHGLKKWLEANNRVGAGVFVCVNETDGKGRTTENIIRIRTVFADFDKPGAFQEANLPLEPHIVVESSPGKFHVYWLVDGLALGEFEQVQTAIAHQLETDRKVKDLPRVMRLPGFYHQKAKPFRVTCRTNELQSYTPDQILAAFPVVARTEEKTDSGIVGQGERNDYLFKRACRLRKAGFSTTEMLSFIRGLNRERCKPPLDNEEVEYLVKSASKSKNRDSGFKLIPLSGFKVKPIDWSITDILLADSLALFFGDPESGKTFLAIDIALCMAYGRKWHGHVVKQCPVVYIAGEGHNGMAIRFAAWRKHYSEQGDADFYCSNQAAALFDADSAKRVENEIHALNAQPKLIVVDTLARNFGGGNESATEDMNKFIRNVDNLRRPYDATALIVHHTGHKEKNRARGAFTLTCAMDTEYQMSRDGDLVSFENTKMKDAERAESKMFEFQKVILDEKDAEDDPVTSVILKERTAREKKVWGKNQQAIFDLLKEMFVTHRTNLEADEKDPDTARVEVTEWKKKAKQHGIQRNRFSEALKGLNNSGLIKIEGIHVSIIDQ